MLSLHQFVDQTGRGGKTYPALLPTGSHAESSEQMGLAGAAFTNKQDGFGAIDVAAFGQVSHIRRLPIRRRRAIELPPRFHSRPMSFPDSAFDRVECPFFDLGQQ